MPPQAKIWTAKTQPRLATLNVRGTTAGKVSLPAIVSDGPGKGRQVNCEVQPDDLDAVMATVLKAIQSRDAEAAWRESRATSTAPEKTKGKTDIQKSRQWAKMVACACGCETQTNRRNGYAWGHKGKHVAAEIAAEEKSGIEVLQEMLTLDVPQQRTHGGARRMIDPPNPNKEIMLCLCGCKIATKNINGYAYGHRQKALVK